MAQPRHAFTCTRGRGKTGVTADRNKIEFRLFSSGSIFNVTLCEELFSLPKQNQTMHSYPAFMALVTRVKFLGENPVNRDRSRHVDVKFDFLHERVRAAKLSHTSVGIPSISQTR